MAKALARFTAVIFLFAGLAQGTQAQDKAKPYTLKDGTVRFVCEGPEVTVPAWGHFGTVEAPLSLDPNDLSTAKGNVDVIMLSVRTEDSAWDTMFRRAGFLEIDDHPRSRFVLERIVGNRSLKPNEWVSLSLAGQFTLHGITKKVVVPADAKWVPADPKAKEPEKLFVRAQHHVLWDDYEIAMPTGSTRRFAGDGARIQIELEYAAEPAKKKKKKRKK